MRISYRYILAFGSNLGARELNCQQGEAKLKVLSSAVLIRKSKKLYTEPLRSKKHNTKDHQKYLNYIIEIKSPKSPWQLYQNIFHIENLIGHNRTRPWAPRHLDIDILFACLDTKEDFVLCPPLKYQETSLKIPHHGVWQRDFLCSLLKDDFNLGPKDLRSHYFDDNVFAQAQQNYQYTS